jgi:predicted lipoprotein with Yx(FWY)xxD motif
MMWRWMAAGTGLVTITIGLVAIVTADSEAERDRGGTAAAQPGVEAAAEAGAKGAFEKRSSAKPRRGKRIITGGSQFGRMLFDRKRQAIYVFDKEKGKRSRCYGRCAKEWPPVLTKGRPTAGGKVHRKLLGTTKRRNGTRQVTYAGAPLYYYAHEKPRQVLCHNVISFGGLWQVVGPGGAPRD